MTDRTLSIPCSAGDLAQAVEHRGRRIEGDHLPVRRCQGPGDRQRVAAGTRADVEPALTRSDQRQQGIQSRFVGPRRVGSEQPGDGGVEIGAVGTSRNRSTCSALARTRAAQVACSAATRSARVSMSGLLSTSTGTSWYQLRVRRDDRAEAAVTGNLIDQPEPVRDPRARGCARRPRHRPAPRWAAPRPATRSAAPGWSRPTPRVGRRGR